jgi:uncharacterized protein YrrD
MLFSFEELRGYGIRAADDDIGSVDDLLFEDTTSMVRYLVVETGSWLFGRKVLLAAAALGPVDHKAREITTALTTRQVKDGPGIDADQPVSRQHEEALHSYYDWPPYWSGTPALGPAPYWGGVGLVPPPPAGNPVEREVAEMERQRGDPHLRSAREVIGYYVAATDGDIGHVEDLVIDDATWMLPQLVIDTRNWLPGREVLIDTSRLRSVDWGNRHIVVDLSRREVESSPETDRSSITDRG